MELRRANLSDETPVRALVDAAYARWIPIIGARPEPMLRDYAAVLRHHEVWVHCAPKGRIDAMLELVEAPDHLHIANLAISPERQGRGLGSALLRFAESRARRLQISELHLCLNREMTANQRLYERHGFTPTHAGRIDGLEIVFMAKSLRTAGTDRVPSGFAPESPSVRSAVFGPPGTV
jgi:ribosomal protein S18 acetylase RimI-like enzyme